MANKMPRPVVFDLLGGGGEGRGLYAATPQQEMLWSLEIVCTHACAHVHVYGEDKHCPGAGCIQWLKPILICNVVSPIWGYDPVHYWHSVPTGLSAANPALELIQFALSQPTGI